MKYGLVNLEQLDKTMQHITDVLATIRIDIESHAQTILAADTSGHQWHASAEQRAQDLKRFSVPLQMLEEAIRKQFPR